MIWYSDDNLSVRHHDMLAWAREQREGDESLRFPFLPLEDDFALFAFRR
jgi:hypothetical protein